jgi:hypothetical protein
MYRTQHDAKFSNVLPLMQLLNPYLAYRPMAMMDPGT